MKLPFKFNNLLLYFGVLFIVTSMIVSVWVITKSLTSRDSETGIVEVTEIEPKADSLIDISYEEMRVYIFPNDTMLMIKFPKFLKYLEDGTRAIITIEEDNIKVTTVSNNWNHFTIYCKEESLRFFREGTKKEKLKKRDF